MSGQTWTPAPKKGIIPLHPLTFGTLLGKAFAALRHNPKVLFGFAVVIQLVVTLATAGVMGVVLFTTFSRLETVSPSSPDFEAVLAGTIAINLIVGLAVGLASIAFTAMMQGVVAAEIGYAAIGVKATLRMLWRRMTPAFWRLVGFASLSVVALFGAMAIVAVIIGAMIAGGLGGSTELIGVVVLVIVLMVIAAIPLTVWLATKLLLVPSILVLERARFREAFVRSWRLTRGRFWVAFGVMALISVIMGFASNVVSVPFALLTSMFGTVIAPTGEEGPSSVAGYLIALLVPQALVLVLQAITLVVQSTGAALVYLDCRMRYEGLDQTLISYVERRESGRIDEPQDNPYAVDPNRAVTSAPPPRQLPEHLLMTQGYGYPPAPGQSYPPPTGPAYAPVPGQSYPYAPGQTYAAGYAPSQYPPGPGQTFAAPGPSAPIVAAPSAVQPPPYGAPAPTSPGPVAQPSAGPSASAGPAPRAFPPPPPPAPSRASDGDESAVDGGDAPA